MENSDYQFETLAIRTQCPSSQYREHSTPLYLSSSFTFDSAEQGSAIFKGQEEGNLYSRFSNPNTTEFIDKLCALEHCESGIATASGMAAVYTSFAAILVQGDHILASKDIFGNAQYIITQILPKMGVEYTLVDVDDNTAWAQGVKKNTKLIYLETPSNPTLKIADLRFIANIAKSNNIVSIVDNCFATPYLQNPSDFGIDLVLHSATKYIDGQGRVLGGAILGEEALVKKCYEFIRRTGACLSPFNAWILSKSIETLSLRMDRHCQNAKALTEWLQGHKKMERIYYPFLSTSPQQALAKAQMKFGGGLLGFELKGSVQQSMEFLNQLKIHSLTANLGDSRSIATHPASTTHSKLDPIQQLEMGISPSYIRLSVGLENVNDLIQDIDQALYKIK